MTLTNYGPGEQPVQLSSLVAASDLSAKQYYACKVDTSGKAALCGVGNQMYGIVQDGAVAGDPVQIMVLGISLAILGGSVTAGDNLTPDANGKLVDVSGSNPIVATALVSGSSGDIIPVSLSVRTTAGANDRSVLSVSVPLADITSTSVVPLNAYTPGFAGVIRKVSAYVKTPVTTGSKSASFGLKIGATPVTGGVVALTSANCTPKGAVVDGSAVTAANAFAATDTLTLYSTVVGAAFAEGEVTFLIVLG